MFVNNVDGLSHPAGPEGERGRDRAIVAGTVAIDVDGGGGEEENEE